MKTKKINKGTFDYEHLKYTKKISFTKAVLWKDRQLSLPVSVMEEVRDNGIKTLIFIDKERKEMWKFNAKKVLFNLNLKQVGQETQYYFPIELATKIDYNKGVITELPSNLQKKLF